jgi:putative copper resistance protein D
VSLLVDLFGYLSIVVHGLTILSQSMALGGALFLAFLAEPLAPKIAGHLSLGLPRLQRDIVRLVGWSAVALMLCEGATVALQVAVLVGTVDLPVSDIMQAGFAVAGLVKIAAAFLLILLLGWRGARAPVPLLLILVLVELAAATTTTHAMARFDDRPVLLVVEGLHQLGAAIWIGGMPCFLLALAHVKDGVGWRVVGKRFSRMCMAGVSCILLSGVVMSVLYIGSFSAFYGTAFGVMVGAKIGMFVMLLCLGAGNFFLIERLRRDPSTPVNRMKRFAEVELGIGISIFFAAASLTSVPPGIDLSQDRVSWHEIVERNTPEVPRLRSPDHDALALPALQDKLDAEAAHSHHAAGVAFVPGSGELPPRNAADIAWSEYNHHWSGLFVLLIGVLALLNQAGLRWAKHWPLLFLALAAFLFLRSDPEVWPLGQIGFFESLRDVEVFQHRIFVILIVVFGLFEWRVRAGGWRSGWAPLVFPLLTAGGGALLLTHSHAISNVKDQLLIELTHTPLALLGIAAGWTRWLEIRLDPPGNRAAGWVWPICFVLIAGVLLLYREA